MKLKTYLILLNQVNEASFNIFKYVARFTILLLSVSLLFPQWSSFKLNNNINSTFKYGGLFATYNSPVEIRNDRRIAISSSLNKELSNDGFSPSIESKIKISWNLSIKGKMANFSSDNRAIQMYGWGLTLKPGSIEEPSQWRILFDSGRINSNKQFRLSAMSVSIIKFFAWNNLKLNSGFGTNMVNVLSYNISENYDFQTNYISFGLSTKLFGLVLSPQVLFGSKINFISISIGDFF